MTETFAVRSPLVTLAVTIDAGALVGIRFHADPGPSPRSALGREVRDQLHAYLAGERRHFDLPLELGGTVFQRAVWEALQRIPYGETRSYAQVARVIGRPRASRAVGRANHNNPVPIVVPCHRVVGADGALTGFGGGLELKERLLGLEGGRPIASSSQFVMF